MWAEPRDLTCAAATLFEPASAVGNVSVVCGFRPELWASSNPAMAPRHVAGYTEPIVGADGYTLPSTQHDLLLWVAAGVTSAAFDVAHALSTALREVAVLADETVGWNYHQKLDLTGFIDGTENPPLTVAPSMVLIPDGVPGAGGSVLLLQKWEHDAEAWMSLSTVQQESIIGRTKAESVELEDRPLTSHVARTDQDQLGHIFRRNTAWGNVRRHGTMFVGFSAARRPLHAMLESMAGIDGPRDALTSYSQALTGGYYFVPSTNDLALCL
jgi:putative iron-dependent peroxidase